MNPVFVIDSERSNGNAKAVSNMHPDEVNRPSYGNNKYRCSEPAKESVGSNLDKYIFSESSATLTSFISLSSEYDSLEDQKRSVQTGGSTTTLSTVAEGATSASSSADTSGNNNNDEKRKKPKKNKPVLSAEAKEKKFLSSIRSFVIVLALSIHSIFEGMAIGKESLL